MSEERLQAIENKIETLVDKLHDIHITLTKNTESLIIHEKRTDIAERKIELLNDRIDEMKDRENEQFKELSNLVQEKVESIHEKIQPIKSHVEVMDKTFNIIWKIIIPGVCAIAVALYKLGLIKI